MGSGLILIDSVQKLPTMVCMIPPSRWNQEIATTLDRERFVFQHRWPMKTTTYHRQPGYEIDVILEGNPVLRIQEFKQPLKPRDIVILRGDQPHGFEMSSGQSWTRSVVCFESAFLGVIGDEEQPVKDWLGDKGYFHFSAGPDYFREVEGGLNRMSMEERLRGDFWQALFIGTLAALWGRLRRYGMNPVSTGEQVPVLIRRAMDYVHRNPHEELSLYHVADALRVSPEHLTRTFRHELGLPFGCFLRQTKLEQARKIMLEDPDRTLTEIALSVGFQDSSSFTRAFKRQFAQTPRDYRKQLGRDL